MQQHAESPICFRAYQLSSKLPPPYSRRTARASRLAADNERTSEPGVPHTWRDKGSTAPGRTPPWALSVSYHTGQPASQSASQGIIAALAPQGGLRSIGTGSSRAVSPTCYCEREREREPCFAPRSPCDCDRGSHRTTTVTARYWHRGAIVRSETLDYTTVHRARSGGETLMLSRQRITNKWLSTHGQSQISSHSRPNSGPGESLCCCGVGEFVGGPGGSFV